MSGQQQDQREGNNIYLLHRNYWYAQRVKNKQRCAGGGSSRKSKPVSAMLGMGKTVTPLHMMQHVDLGNNQSSMQMLLL